MGMAPSLAKVWDASAMSLLRDRGLPMARSKLNPIFRMAMKGEH
jgi:hypothetical protein